MPPFIQEAGRVALTSAASAPYVARMVAEFQMRRDWVVGALNEIPGVRCQNPGGSFYVFPNVGGMCERLGVLDAYERLPAARRATTSPTAMLMMFLLYGYGVATMDRNSFGKIGADGQHFLRLSIATSLERLQEGVRRMRAAATDPAGFTRFLSEEQLYG